MTHNDIDNPPMSDKKLATMQPLRKVLPALDKNLKKLRGRPAKEAPKKPISLRLDADIVDWLQSSGKGYQTRMNTLLRDVMELSKQ